ncbi:hypothetical protein [Brazilian porcupinepox virus 1]|nr:hypothetical protein [Brazilian porcupinepox virus 1]
MSNVKKINKIVIGSDQLKDTPSNDEIRKYGQCLNIKKPVTDKKPETYLQNNYPMTIRNNKLL